MDACIQTWAVQQLAAAAQQLCLLAKPTAAGFHHTWQVCDILGQSTAANLEPAQRSVHCFLYPVLVAAWCGVVHKPVTCGVLAQLHLSSTALQRMHTTKAKTMH